VGSIELRTPEAAAGFVLPRMAPGCSHPKQAGVSAEATEAYVRGISTRKVEGLVETLGVTSLSRSQVSELARELDQTVAEFRNRPLDAGRRAGGQMPRGRPGGERGTAAGCGDKQRGTFGKCWV